MEGFSGYEALENRISRGYRACKNTVVIGGYEACKKSC